uniref:Uncharacterized protein LOC104212577 n=1 Tax=Nicotiana sylvestris TaxID=4096 RepID=A0A1U7VEC4_NICSY|nr:PREDICTED: uncharacterized protein LOC104212577 [Nicotiana sylvestris]
MDISRIQAFAQNIERGRRRQQSTERTESEQRKRMRFARYHEQSQGPGESSQASGLQRQRGSGQTWPVPPRCTVCGRGHLGQCQAGSDACYICRHSGHMMRDCPNRDFGGMAQPANSATGSTLFVYPSGRESQSSAGRGRGRGRGSSLGGS